MASKMRRVRRHLRKEMLAAVNAGEGNLAYLMEIAGRLLGQDVGFNVLFQTFCASEVSNGLAQLRNEGLIESTGKLWKTTESLQGADVEIISVRRLKRLKGELQSQIRLAHDHGRTEEAVALGRMLEIIQHQLDGAEPAEETAEEAVAPAT